MKEKGQSIELKKAVLSPVVFFDIFNHALSPAEIHKFSFGKTIPYPTLDSILNKYVYKRYGLCFIKGKQSNSDISNAQSDVSKRLLGKAFKYAFLFRYLPYVKMVAVCNNVAFNCADSDSDIDLFIITERNRIFITRSVITILFHLLMIRRHGRLVKGRFCLSFFISESNMNLQKIALKNDIYLHYWFRTLIPLYGFDQFNLFREKNYWANKMFPNSPSLTNDACLEGKSVLRKTFEYLLRGNIGSRIESLLSKSHQRRFKNRKKILSERASVIISDEMLKFHNVDKRNQYKASFVKMMNLLLHDSEDISS